MSLPILYSFRRCPYAMRARLAIYYSQTVVELREVVLKNKPTQMIQASSKATVPVLVLATDADQESEIIDESIEIVYWALAQHDPEQWLLSSESGQTAKILIAENDDLFKASLDKYKYFDRFPEFDQAHYRAQGEMFLAKLEQRLSQHHYLFADQPCVADIAIMPFVRQFAYVDIDWFKTAGYPKLLAWLNVWLESEMFKNIMHKYPAWHEHAELTLFADNDLN